MRYRTDWVKKPTNEGQKWKLLLLMSNYWIKKKRFLTKFNKVYLLFFNIFTKNM